MGSKACYWCGQEGHKIKECSKKNRAQGVGTLVSALVQQTLVGKRDNQPWQGRAFALIPGNTLATHSVVPLILPN